MMRSSKPNNPMQTLMQARRSGMTPMQFLQRNVQNNPQAQEAMRVLGGSQADQQAFAQRLAQARGIDLNAFVRQMGF